MIRIDVPGYKTLEIHHLVLDYNGTLAVDGRMLPGVRETLNTLAEQVEIHVLTADTFGQCKTELSGVRCSLSVLPPENQDIAKLDYVRSLGSENAACIGNGRNDRLMLRKSALGICVILAEGASAETLDVADVVCTDILAALNLLLSPLRLIATLRT